MQLSLRILTALAVLMLFVAVLVFRVGDSGDGVDAATGTIDVLNVGTCYTTDDSVFSVGDCKDGDGNNSYDVLGQGIAETSTVVATYSYDPKTAGDAPRGILRNSDMIKVSIKDSGRDRRTPVVLKVGSAGSNTLTADQLRAIGNYETGSMPGQIMMDGSGGGTIVGSMYWTGTGEDTGFDNVMEHGAGLLELRISKSDDDESYRPMHADVDGGAVIKFYGTAGTDGAFRELGRSHLRPDEDTGEGDIANVAPWLNVQVHDRNIDLQYIVYNTSEIEVLAGGLKSGDYTETNGNPTAMERPQYTNDEGGATANSTADDVALVVNAQSDGIARSQNLWLKETGRFTGVYEGYLMLTDANGNGGGTNWGVATGRGTRGTDDDGMDGAAVLGVESGPVVINYRDTDGQMRTMSISIDTVPPSVQIDTPVHKSKGRDTTPNFSGSFSDTDSGLREDSFRLYVDETNDMEENGVSGTPALDLTVDDMADDSGYVANPGATSKYKAVNEYMGYMTKSQFGVIGHEIAFDLAGRDGDLGRNGVVEGDAYDDGASSGTFNDSERIRILDDSGNEVSEYNNQIDFQALVSDVAGNIGLSDSNDAGPRLINNYNRTVDEGRNTGRYNGLGWYSRHIFSLDEKPPAAQEDQTVTGFYGEDSSGNPVVNRSGILVSFDAAIDPDSVATDTFEIMLDDDSMATITDVTVAGAEVYLMLAEELASDATPKVAVAPGKAIIDPAFNRTTSGNWSPFDAKDGIAPKLTITLSGGSGMGEGSEGPSGLTKDAITIMVDADEEIQTTPSITVVCSNIAWGDDSVLSDFTGARSGPLDKFTPDFGNSPSEFMCGSDDTMISPQQVQSFSRPGLQWEYQWRNFDDAKALPDGNLTVVAYARDRKTFNNLSGDSTYNWGVTTAAFKYDTTAPTLDATPADGSTTTEVRPFVLLNYDDASTVSIDTLQVDSAEQEASVLGSHRFLYWPESLSLGSHSVSVKAMDAAGNSSSDAYSFKVAARKTFNIKLIAGWNAVSVPANPVDPMIESVFTDPVIDMVASWDGSDPEKPWSIASKVDGEWDTHSDFATLTKISAKYGYWVHTHGFTTQPVALVGKINREAADVVPADLIQIPTSPGWNFVGVIDQEGDQTQDHFGEALENGANISAREYLGSYVRAYTWDPVRSRFQVLDGDSDLMIGDGIWVYYGSGIAP